MDRRTAGVVLVLLAIVGVVVIAVTPGRRLTGSPTAAPFPASPAAGDCLLDPTDPDNRPAGSRRIPVFGPCSGHATLGEVVAVRIASGGSVGPVEPRGCRTEALHRAGLQGSTTFRPVGAPAVGPVDWTSAEHMRTIAQYRLGVIVGYNAAPPRRGLGSCIFLHIWAGPSSTTTGCTAMDAGALAETMAWLDPARRPTLVQLPSAAYGRLRGAWGLP